MSKTAKPQAELIRRLAALPPFPSAALRLLTISADSETVIPQYEEVFKSDPALATELLRVANSYEFGLVATVATIRQALTLLGLDRVNSLGVTLAMQQYSHSSPRLNTIQPIWAHAIATAVIAEALAKVAGCPPGSLYTAGLVHDIGRLGLLMTAPTRYADLLAQAVSGRDAVARLEAEQFGLTHSEVGAIMADAWGFPDWLRAVISHHDSAPGEQPADPRLRLAQIACLFASALGYTEQGDPPGADPGRLELPPDLRGHPSLEPEPLRQQVVKLIFAMTRTGR